jgi:hypothetical protein
MRGVSIFTYGQIVVRHKERGTNRRTCYYVEIGNWISSLGSVQYLTQVLEESVYPGFHSAPPEVEFSETQKLDCMGLCDAQ